MREFPRGGLIGKTVHLVREISGLRVSLYAANAGFFLVLAVFPGLVLLLGMLRYTPLEVEGLGELLASFLPEALAESAEELILTAYDNFTPSVLGLSALTALWSAGRGVYGLLTGLNAVYDVEETRGYFRTRLLCAGYTLAFLVILILTLGFHVFGTRILGALEDSPNPLLRLLTRVLDLRFFVLLFLQTGLFTAMFLALPDRRGRFWDNVPGALLAASGWLIFSDLYSIYVERFAHLSTVYGPVYAVALSMLWLYCCLAILFYGGALNRHLELTVDN